jgi:hypothetical protein
LDGKRCNKDHEHEHVMGGSRVTAAAGLYTKELAREIIKGLEEEFEKTYGCGLIHETLAVDGAETDGDLEDALDREVDPQWNSETSMKVTMKLKFYQQT